MNAGRHRPSIILFIASASVLLVADLLGKHFAFERVADRPIHLVHVNGGPVDHDALNQDSPLNIAADHPELIPQPPEGITALPHVLHLRLTTNTGAVFGLGKGGRWIFAAVSLLAVIIIVRLFWRSEHHAIPFHLCLAMILAGALGNMYDRIRYGAVRDFLYIFPGTDLPFGLQWPSGGTRLYPWIFNIADAALVVGVLMLMLIMWRSEGRGRGENDAGPPPPTDGKAPD